MKRLIRLIINLIPRPILQRMAGWAVPLLGLIYVGRGRECPVCGTKRRKFLPYGYVTSRDNALCPTVCRSNATVCYGSGCSARATSSSVARNCCTWLPRSA